jgi:hypothetical protein
MEPVQEEIVNARSLAPLEYDVTEDLVLRTNPELNIVAEGQSYVTIPQSSLRIRLTEELQEVMEAFYEPSRAGSVCRGSWQAFSTYVRQLLAARILLSYEVNCLITGCGRSGTVYISCLLDELGADVPHETMGLDGIASWLLAVDAGWAPWGPLRRMFQYRAVLHQVRHPLAAIASAQTFRPESWDYICGHIPCDMTEPLLLRCGKYWHYWNLKAEQTSEWTYRIEELPRVFDRLCETVGVSPDRSRLVAVPADLNSRKERYSPISWDQLAELDSELTHKIQAQAARYGYAAE